MKKVCININKKIYSNKCVKKTHEFQNKINHRFYTDIIINFLYICMARSIHVTQKNDKINKSINKLR